MRATHPAISWTDNVHIRTRPSSLHRVMCLELSSIWPQLGQIFFTSGLIRDSCLFVPQNLDVCFVTKTRNILGNSSMAPSTPSQYTRVKSCQLMMCLEW